MINTIENIEKKLGYNLPAEYIAFLKSANKEKYHYKEYCRVLLDGYKTDGLIDRFATIESFWEDNKYREFIEEFQEQSELTDEYVESQYLYLIALSASGGICMALNGRHKGKIYSVDNGDFGITFQANNIKEFLESLYSSSDYRCEYKNIKAAVSENNLPLLRELIEEKDGHLILSRSSYCDREIFDIAYENHFVEILDYLISKGFNGFDRVKLYNLK